MDGSLPNLLGLDWFASLGLGITGVNFINEPTTKNLQEEFAEVFDGKLGKYKGTPISFNLEPQVAPIRLKPRRVSFALRLRVDGWTSSSSKAYWSLSTMPSGRPQS